MTQASERTADDLAFNESRGSGCCSGFLIPPLVVLMIAALAGLIVFKSPAPVGAFAPPPQAPSALSGVFTPEVQYWSASILRWALISGVDPNLVAVVMQIESCGNPFARSRAGALGLFQVMPYHFATTDDPYSPDINAERGLAYLRRALSASDNDVRLALAGYNGGISRISSAEWTWPAETGRYAYWGSGIYADAASGSGRSARLEQWLAAGGAGLCRGASQQLAIAD